MRRRRVQVVGTVYYIVTNFKIQLILNKNVFFCNFMYLHISSKGKYYFYKKLMTMLL